MAMSSATAWKGVIAAIAAIVVFFLLVIRPIYNDAADLRRQTDALDQANQRTERDLAAMPPVPVAEKKLWPLIAQRVESTLYEEADVMSAVVNLQATVRDSGARALSPTAEEPEEPPPQPSRPFPRPPRTELMGEDLERTAERMQGAELQTPTPRVASQTPRPAPPRREEVPERALPEIGRTIRNYTVVMEIEGSYAKWADIFNRLSAQVEPVLIEKIEAAAGADGGVMKLTVAVPVLAPGESRTEAPGEGVDVDPETERLYYLRRLREPLAGTFPVTRGEPFPPVAVVSAGAAALPRPTAIVWRNGVPAAVFGTKIVRVGETVGGKRVVAIEDNKVYFEEN